MKRVLLFDGDVLLYKAASALEMEIDWGDDLWTLHTDTGEVYLAVKDMIHNIMEDLGGDDFRIAFSCPSDKSYRRRLNPEYKANRTTRKPLAYYHVREKVVDEFNGIIRSRLEADDVLGILATEPQKTEERIIVSADKDFKTIPCKFYRIFTADPDTMHETSRKEAFFSFMEQTLAGDRTDGYGGVPGVGPVRARKILSEARTRAQAWEAVVNAYERENLGPEEALLNARMAYILQWPNFNTKTNKIKLWTPPKSRK